MMNTRQIALSCSHRLISKICEYVVCHVLNPLPVLNAENCTLISSIIMRNRGHFLIINWEVIHYKIGQNLHHRIQSQGGGGRYLLNSPWCLGVNEQYRMLEK